ncbi:pilus assembly protein TadG, partial [Corallococcus praedator]
TDVIILMSDGLNTENRDTKDDPAWDVASKKSKIDDREKKICANIKAAGITVYAIQVNTGGDPTQTVMQNCATDVTKFFEIKQATGMVTVFSQIGTALSQLRISD